MHAVVVLVPLCFVGVVIAAFSRTWRQRLAIPILVLLGVGVVASFIATGSGSRTPCADRCHPRDDHDAHIGIWVPWFVLIALGLTALWLFLEQRAGPSACGGRIGRGGPGSRRCARSPSHGVRLTACVLAVASCGFATGWIAYVGEAGSSRALEALVISTNNK